MDKNFKPIPGFAFPEDWDDQQAAAERAADAELER